MEALEAASPSVAQPLALVAAPALLELMAEPACGAGGAKAFRRAATLFARLLAAKAGSGSAVATAAASATEDGNGSGLGADEMGQIMWAGIGDGRLEQVLAAAGGVLAAVAAKLAEDLTLEDARTAACFMSSVNFLMLAAETDSDSHRMVATMAARHPISACTGQLSIGEAAASSAARLLALLVDVLPPVGGGGRSGLDSLAEAGVWAELSRQCSSSVPACQLLFDAGLIEAGLRTLRSVGAAAQWVSTSADGGACRAGAAAACLFGGGGSGGLCPCLLAGGGAGTAAAAVRAGILGSGAEGSGWVGAAIEVVEAAGVDGGRGGPATGCTDLRVVRAAAACLRLMADDPTVQRLLRRPQCQAGLQFYTRPTAAANSSAAHFSTEAMPIDTAAANSSAVHSSAEAMPIAVSYCVLCAITFGRDEPAAGTPPRVRLGGFQFSQQQVDRLVAHWQRASEAAELRELGGAVEEDSLRAVEALCISDHNKKLLRLRR